MSCMAEVGWGGGQIFTIIMKFQYACGEFLNQVSETCSLIHCPAGGHDTDAKTIFPKAATMLPVLCLFALDIVNSCTASLVASINWCHTYWFSGPGLPNPMFLQF